MPNPPLKDCASGSFEPVVFPLQPRIVLAEHRPPCQFYEMWTERGSVCAAVRVSCFLRRVLTGLGLGLQTDEAFYVGLGRQRSEQMLTIHSGAPLPQDFSPVAKTPK